MQNYCNTNGLEVRHTNFTRLILSVVKGLGIFFACKKEDKLLIFTVKKTVVLIGV